MNGEKLDSEKLISVLLSRRLTALHKLLIIIAAWNESSDYENESAFFMNLTKRQELIDEIVLIDRELRMTHLKGTKAEELSQEDERLTERAKEVLTQIELMHRENISQLNKYILFCAREAKRLRLAKNSLGAYIRNSEPVTAERYSARG